MNSDDNGLYKKLTKGKSLTTDERETLKNKYNFNDNNDNNYNEFKNHINKYHHDGTERTAVSKRLGYRFAPKRKGGSFRKATPNAKHTRSKNNKKPNNTKKHENYKKGKYLIVSLSYTVALKTSLYPSA